jgi:hypothetical protein
MKYLASNTLTLIVIISLFSCSGNEKSGFTTYLDSAAFDLIVNLYGPPYRNVSFGKDTLQIKDQTFTRGLGTHAPAELNINLNGQATYFSSMAGIDHEITKLWDAEQREKIENFPKYVYDNKADHYDSTAGGTVIFRVLVDDEVAFESELIHYNDPPQPVEVDLTGAEKLTLIADPTDDGSYADHINWANASITWKKKPEAPVTIYNYPDDVLVNHIGFLPQSFKTCYTYGTEQIRFNLMESSTGNSVFSGTMLPDSGALGTYLVGDFSDFNKTGNYYVQIGDRKSEKFSIAEDVYLQALQANVNYINQQRSGDTTAGWAKGQHLDDGIRQDNRRHQDVTGGWYDANDLRKPMRGNSLLLLALATIAEHDFPTFNKMALLEEMQWGNKFLLAMQEPKGYVMSYIGSTKDGMMENRWSDNIIGNEDDRTILTNPADASHQMIFALANAKIARLYQKEAADYTNTCLTAAEKAWSWTTKNQELNEPDILGIAISAAVELFKASGNEKYKEQAVKFTEELLAMQKEGDEYLKNHFFTFGEKAKTYGGRWIMLGLRNFILAYPDHELKPEVENSLQQFVEGYYLPLTQLNSFSIIPWIFATESLGSGKQLGPYHYRNFLHVGMNQHLSSKGVVMNAAYDVTQKPDYLKIAQKQLDWIYGANPFNASSVTGMGYNQPALFKTLPVEFSPYTPELKGGVMTGIGSNPEDKIAFFPGYWWTTEYWSPSVTYTMLLTIMLQENYERKN